MSWSVYPEAFSQMCRSSGRLSRSGWSSSTSWGQIKISGYVICVQHEQSAPCLYLQDVVQQRDPGLVGFSFSQSEQSADFKAVSVPSVSSLKQNILNGSRLQLIVRLDSSSLWKQKAVT